MAKTVVQKLLKRNLQVFLLTVILFNPLYAGGGKLTGKVIEKNTGEPLSFANIVITNVLQDGQEVSLPIPMGARTDTDGYYVILDIPTGTYTIKASVVGYSTLVVKEVKIDPDRTITLNFELESATISTDVIFVTAKREVIKADVSSTQELISSERIESLPILRVDEYFGKLKGVQLSSTSDGYGLVIRGGAIRETDVRMDGISLQDPRSGTSYLGFNSTAVSEIQILTGGFEAKYGGIRSGILDVKTKDGNREKFTASIKTDFTPKGQFRFFGTNPFSSDSWIYKVYTGEYAFTGVPKGSKVPVDLQDFKGWAKTTSPAAMKGLDSLQRLELWKLQHPQYAVADKPDFVVEGTFTGPFVLPNTTFMAGFKYENSQFALPIGPRDNYIDWNTQLKLTTTLEDMKFSVNGMYAKVFSNTSRQSVSYDYSQSFGYMNNNTPSSINRQIAAVAGSSILSIYNKSRFQEYEQTFAMGGVKFTHVPMQRLFYTIDFQMGYTGQDITPMLMDMSADSSQNYIYVVGNNSKKGYWFYLPTTGLPNGTTNLMADGMGKFYMYGGGQWADSSYSYNFQLKGDLTWQANKNNQVQAGFSASLQSINVYAGFWNQSSLLFTPNSWQYYKATPLDIGLYLQDKLEFEGMILNAGLRVDYFNAMKDRYTVGFPEDKDYTKLFTEIYNNLGGNYNSYERWLLFRELLDDPTGWPATDNDAQIKVSPRLGVAFPITENSKMYFNYGHFYQRPSASILYNMKLDAASTTVPSSDLAMAKTVQYEFGYEQVFLEDLLFNVTAYYKDISNEPLTRVFVDYNETNKVTKYFPDGYKDIKGVELRFERNVGRFVTFSAMYDYMITSEGYAGYKTIYENLAYYRENELRTAVQYSPKAIPRANINLNLHTPADYGMLFGNWFANFFFEWKDGGEILLNQDQELVRLQHWAEVVNYWNIDFKGSKEFNILNSTIEIAVIIKNLTNNKWLNTDNMTQAEYSSYKNEIEASGGKWGEYKTDNISKILENSWENVLFLNPRRIIISARINL